MPERPLCQFESHMDQTGMYVGTRRHSSVEGTQVARLQLSFVVVTMKVQVI